MFNNKFKASLRKFWELSWADRCNLKAWLLKSTTANTFDMETLNNPSILVASAINAMGEAVVYCPVQKVFLISGFAVSPTATEAQAHAAGDLIDAELERQAHLAGVSKMLILVPADHPSLQNSEWDDFKEVRVFERKFPQTVGTGGIRLHKANSLLATFIN